MSSNGGFNGSPEDTGRESSPYIELDRSAWAALAEETTNPLSPEEIRRLRGLGDALDIEEVQEVYLPLSACSACTSRRRVGCTASRRTSCTGAPSRARRS